MTQEEVDNKLKMFMDAIDNGTDSTIILQLRDDWVTASNQMPTKALNEILPKIEIMFGNNSDIMNAIIRLKK